MSRNWIILGALGLALAPATTAAAASDPPAGTYAGTLTGGEASLVVRSNMHAKLRFALRTKCGSSHGKVALELRDGRFTGRRVTGAQTTVVKGRFVAGGTKARGSLRQIAGRNASGGCRAGAGQLRFSLARRGGSQAGDAATGHYAGSGATGLPISFDLVPGDGNRMQIENFAVDVLADCWGDSDHDGVDDTLVVHARDFSGGVEEDGSFDIDWSPDDNTELEFDGTIADGQAMIEATVGGNFDADGTPDPAGPRQCDSWGDEYLATRQP